MAVSDPETTLSALPKWVVKTPRMGALLEEHQNPALAFQYFGIECFQAGDHKLAVKAFKEATTLSPGQAIYQNNLGVALNATGAADGAIAAFRASLEIDQNQPQIWLNLAYTLKPLGRLVEAEQALVAASEHASTAAEAWTALGTIELERGNYAKAVASLQRAMKGGEGNANLHASLGAALFQLGKAGEAATEYTIAAQLNSTEAGYRENVNFLTMLAGVIAGDAEAAITAYAKPLSEDAVLLGAFNRALIFLASFDYIEAASALVAEWIQYYPTDEDALYFQQVYAGKPLTRAPPSYIAHYFDRLAPLMDARFLKAIAYHVPEQMAAVLAKAVGRKWRGDILDAGCGSGALGRALKPYARSVTGVDLSPQMVQMAEASAVYDRVVVDDLLIFLQGASQSYDLIAAADSLIYFGELQLVFAAAYAALRPGGWFMLSLETTPGEGTYVLTPNGRFCHAKAYVAAVGQKAFSLVRDKDVILRTQGQKQIAGTIFLFQKK